MENITYKSIILHVLFSLQVPVTKPHPRPRTQRGHLRVPVTPVRGVQHLRGRTLLPGLATERASARPAAAEETATRASTHDEDFGFNEAQIIS